MTRETIGLLSTLYGYTKLDRHWTRFWLDAWWH